MLVEEKICLPAKYLDNDYKYHLHRKICEKLLGTCNQTYGYILNIGEKLDIIDNNINAIGTGVIFHVRFDVQTLKPEKGQCLQGKVCMVFQLGILVEVCGKMKVFIPSPKKIVSEGDILDIVIDQINYERKNFSCIGSLKTD